MKKIWFFLVMAMIAVASVHAMDESIAYQGVLRDEKGNAFSNDLTRTIEFRLYTAPASAQKDALWGRTIAVQLDSRGLFNCELGDVIGSSIPDTKFSVLGDALRDARGKSLYIGLSVLSKSGQASGEISPRQRIMSVPYSTYAMDVDSAKHDFSVKGNLTANHATLGNLDTTNAVVRKTLTIEGDIEARGTIEVKSTGTFVGNGIVPIGTVVMYSGSIDDIPSGWALCDGKDGRPDLSGRFVVGVGKDDQGNSYKLTDSGGLAKVALTVGEMPPHSHTHRVNTVGYDACWNRKAEAIAAPGQGRNNDTRDLTTGSTGKGMAHENRPPYYALFYIIRVQ